MKDLPAKSIELVRWRDSLGCASRWSELPDGGDQIPAIYCYSIGIVWAEDDDHIVIVPHYSPSNPDADSGENGCGDMTIPKSAIIDRKVLRRAKPSGDIASAASRVLRRKQSSTPKPEPKS